MATKSEAQYRHRAYLRSDAWHALQQAALARDRHRCRICNGKDQLEVHHRRYPFPGQPDHIDNLTTLCRRHHRLVGGFAQEQRVGLVWQAVAWLLIGLIGGVILTVKVLP